MPDLSDDDILEIIDFLPGFIGADEDAARLVAFMRQALTFLPDHPHCCIDAVVPFVTALAAVLTTMPKWDGDLPLNCRLSEGWVRHSRIAEVAGEVMAMTERGGIGSRGARMAVDMALSQDWLQKKPSAHFADQHDPEVRATIAGKRRYPLTQQLGIASLHRPATATRVMPPAEREVNLSPTAIPATTPVAQFSRSIVYVTRDQLAAVCGVSKDTLERWINGDPNAPEPIIEGGGGRAHQYDWAKAAAVVGAEVAQSAAGAFPRLPRTPDVNRPP